LAAFRFCVFSGASVSIDRAAGQLSGFMSFLADLKINAYPDEKEDLSLI